LIIGFVAAPAITAVGARGASVGVAVAVTVTVTVAGRGFVVSEVEIIGAEVAHAGFSFDVGDAAFESVGHAIG
jgi:hypothetical protein